MKLQTSRGRASRPRKLTGFANSRTQNDGPNLPLDLAFKPCNLCASIMHWSRTSGPLGYAPRRTSQAHLKGKVTRQN